MNWTTALLSVGLLLAPGSAHSQAQPGDLGIFFTAMPTTGAAALQNGVVAFEPMPDVFVVSFDVPGGMQAYEFRLELPPGLLISGDRSMPPGALDYGAGEDNWIVDLPGQCIGMSGATALVRYAAPIFLADPGVDLELCLWPAEPNVGGAVPDYLVCNAPGDIRDFGAAYRGCAGINRTLPLPPVPAYVQSFGELKAEF